MPDAAKPDYGLDAPGVVRGFFIGGPLLIVAGRLLIAWGNSRGITIPRGIPLSWGYAMFYTGIVLFLEALLMTASSRYGKFRARDLLLDRLNLRGDESVLDVGCGHGLLLIGAAKRLPRGRATGIDLWSQVDQGSNSKEATLRNAALEGVAGRVEVHTGDMRKLPFADGAFDVAVANLAIHNVPTREGRRQAIAEIVRVLKPGGRAALMDFKKVGDYARDLRSFGVANARAGGPIFWIFPPVRIAIGEKPASKD